MRSRFSKSLKKETTEQEQSPNIEVSEQSNTIEFEVNKEKYKLTISNDSNQIKFILQDISSSEEYHLEKTLDDLKKLNRYFLFFSDPYDLSITLIKQVKKNNITVSKDSNSCNLQIKNPINDEEFSLKLDLSESNTQSNPDSNIKESLVSSPNVSKLEKRIELLEKKMEELESKISSGINIVGAQEGEDVVDSEKIFTSNIISHKEEKIIKSWFNTKIQQAELIFDTSTDGDTIDDFKKKCFGEFPTLIIIRTDMGFMLGGYATTAWKENGPLTDYNSFVFSFNPDKKYNVTMPRFALFGCNNKEKILFQFGSVCFRIEDNCTKNGNNVIRGSGYEKGLIDLIKGDHKFRVSRLEVFKLSF
jgi:hypothetical protein